MKLNYSNFTRYATDYLHRKRSHSRLWNLLLPEQSFSAEILSRNPRSVALGAAWGVFWAIAPVPMQSIFAVYCAMRSRANVGIALIICWLTFPGYQIVVWPVQWWVGHQFLSLFGAASDFSLNKAVQLSQNILKQPFPGTVTELGHVLPTVGVELLLGCLITCPLAALAVGMLLFLLFRIFQHGKT